MNLYQYYILKSMEDNKMYQWGYLKNSILFKLDIDEEEANTIGFLNRFFTYANEAMTQICSTVKPKRTYYEFDVTTSGTKITMPDDFVSFGDDVNVITEDKYSQSITRDADDEDFEYYGYNSVICHSVGKYRISYNARWLIFRDQDNDTILNAPTDVLDCIPSYVASQCMKVDNEYKSSVFRNEYEILLARIDDSNYKSNKTFKIGGDW